MKNNAHKQWLCIVYTIEESASESLTTIPVF